MYCYAPEEDGRYRMVWFQYGPWQKATDYRGLTNSLVDLYMEPEVSTPLIWSMSALVHLSLYAIIAKASKEA